MKPPKAKSEDSPSYAIHSDDAIIAQALTILKSRLDVAKVSIGSPNAARDYWRMQLAQKQQEVFCCLFVNSQHRVIACETMFTGTLSQTSVYPREVVKAALHHNAAAVFFCHNHPSGVAEPSRADELLTTCLKQSLALVDIKVLDHFIVAGTSIFSFAERGLL